MHILEIKTSARIQTALVKTLYRTDLLERRPRKRGTVCNNPHKIFPKFSEKIWLNEKIRNFRIYGLSKQTKFLYVFTTVNFDVTTRPSDYLKAHIVVANLKNVAERHL